MRARPLSLVLATALVLPLGAAQAVASPTRPVPAASSEVETVTGEVQRLAVDKFDGESIEITVIVPDEGDAVRVENEALEGVDTRAVATVDVTDVTVESQEDPAETGGAEVLDVDVVSAPDEPVAGTAAAPRTSGAIALAGRTREVYITTALLKGQRGDGVTTGQLKTDLTERVAPYWSDSTAGAVKLAFSRSASNKAYSSWGSLSSCTPSQYINLLAWTSAQAGYSSTTGHGNHAVVYTPPVSACWFAGLAHIDDGGAIWLNGDTSAETRSITFTHEVGHNLTLGHSNSRFNCDAGADGTASECYEGDYGDAYDVMGTSWGMGPLGAVHLDTLGLLTSTSTVSTTSTRTAELKPVAGSTGTRFIKVALGGTTYFVEYRGAVGRDADLGSDRLGFPLGASAYEPGDSAYVYRPGVIVRRVDKRGIGAEGALLDAGVGDPSWSEDDPWFVLPAGRTFVNRDRTMKIKTVALANGTATVQVSIAPKATITGTSGTSVASSTYYTRSSSTTLSWKASSNPGVVRQEILRNGTVVKTIDPAVRSTSVPLVAGTNKLAVRTVTSGYYSTSVTRTVVRDTAAPTFTSNPRFTFRTGAIVNGTIPTTLSWKATDSVKLRDVSLMSPFKLTQAPKSYVWVSAPWSGSKTWKVRARDYAGWTKTVEVRSSTVASSQTAAKRSNSWKTYKSSSYTGGTAIKSKTRNASFTYSFTGRSFAWVASKTPSSGQADVYVDGRKIKTVDLRSSTTKHRQVVFVHNWTSSAKHSVKVVVRATSGRPWVTSDALVVQK